MGIKKVVIIGLFFVVAIIATLQSALAINCIETRSGGPVITGYYLNFTANISSYRYRLQPYLQFNCGIGSRCSINGNNDCYSGSYESQNTTFRRTPPTPYGLPDFGYCWNGTSVLCRVHAFSSSAAPYAWWPKYDYNCTKAGQVNLTHYYWYAPAWALNNVTLTCGLAGYSNVSVNWPPNMTSYFTNDTIIFSMNYSNGAYRNANVTLWANWSGDWKANISQKTFPNMTGYVNITIQNLTTGYYNWTFRVCEYGEDLCFFAENRSINITDPPVTPSLPFFTNGSWIKPVPVYTDSWPGCYANWTNDTQIANYTVNWWTQNAGVWALNKSKTEFRTFVLNFEDNDFTADNRRPTTSNSTYYVQGISGKALYVNNTIFQYNNTNLINITPEGTISFWINWTTNYGGAGVTSEPFIFSANDYYSSMDYARLSFWYNTKSVRLAFSNNMETLATEKYFEFTYPTKNEWHFIVFTWNFGADRITAYVDGKLNKTEAMGYAYQPWTPNLITFGNVSFGQAATGTKISKNWSMDMFTSRNYEASAELIKWEYDNLHVPMAIDSAMNESGFASGTNLVCEVCAWNNNSVQGNCQNSTSYTVVPRPTIFVTATHLMRVLGSKSIINQNDVVMVVMGASRRVAKVVVAA